MDKCKNCIHLKIDNRNNKYFLCDYKEKENNNNNYRFSVPVRIKKRVRKNDYSCRNFKKWVDFMSLK